MSKLPYIPNWNRMSVSTGYPVVHCPGHPRAWSTGYVLAHRVVMEQSLDRLLEVDEIVHHIDHDKSNYKLSNLELTSQSSHSKGHARPSTVLDMVCVNCGLEFKRRKGQDPEAKGSVRTFCSKSCSSKFYHSKGFNFLK